MAEFNMVEFKIAEIEHGGILMSRSVLHCGI